MKKEELVGRGKKEFLVERLIEKEVQLIRDMNSTRPVAKRKRYSLCKKIRNLNKERNICFKDLTSHLKSSQRINSENNLVFNNTYYENDFLNEDDVTCDS